MALETQVCAVRENKPLQRKELMLRVSHGRASTPSKEEIASQISSLFKVKKDLVVVYGCLTKFGTNETKCSVKVYDSFDTLKRVEKKSVIKSKTGEESKRNVRRVRKDARKKKAKIFGTMRRHVKKAERRARK